mmetsp:Transcript_22470/g.27453  ORF Transcript_22470/g.27453 Transcript_22470/m.27453 type:complete len:278 (+) Transcript_22470:61-894(+)|eukprot:CAMPEP_0194394800 /NCGR_PEP_ID=MMETSP0174-20130528/124057_1 /TAXON_ID=216777 /ORGANISM="Proboscia alata, Strain PI-D3" /LENGTH=277 /DNA_ID=CAMNT_0039190641 /DNA_START=44 /DNA_END=877 /DNA_ORIENTATION=+
MASCNNNICRSIDANVDRRNLSKKRRKTTISSPVDSVSAADFLELKKAYRFVPANDVLVGKGKDGDDRKEFPYNSENLENKESSNLNTTWQERMAHKYHQCLFREYALADLSRCPSGGSVGLRWRTEKEVRSGKGQFTCGNKHCPFYDNDKNKNDGHGLLHYRSSSHDNADEGKRALALYYSGEESSEKEKEKQHVSKEAEEQYENTMLAKLIHGVGLHSYEVNFAYVEEGINKNELVKLRLCLRCAPILFASRGGAIGAKKARLKNTEALPSLSMK